MKKLRRRKPLPKAKEMSQMLGISIQNIHCEGRLVEFETLVTGGDPIAWLHSTVGWVVLGMLVQRLNSHFRHSCSSNSCSRTIVVLWLVILGQVMLGIVSYDWYFWEWLAMFGCSRNG